MMQKQNGLTVGLDIINKGEKMEQETIEAMLENPIAVYVKVNEEGYVTDVNSDIFLKDFTGWQKIDEGFGDKYAHAQSQYFGNILSEDGKFIIKIKE